MITEFVVADDNGLVPIGVFNLKMVFGKREQ